MARLVDRQPQVIEVEEGLDHEQVHTALEQRIDLLAECRPDRSRVVMTELPRRRAQGPDAPRNPGVPTAHIASLAGDLRRPPVEPGSFRGEAEHIEPEPVGAERQGLDQLGAGLEVLAVNGGDKVRARGGQLVEAGPLRDAAREQERAHAAVGQQRAGGQACGESITTKAHAEQQPSR